jgi:hypothetical protein
MTQDPGGKTNAVHGLGLVPMVVEQTSRGERSSTSIRACSRNG